MILAIHVSQILISCSHTNILFGNVSLQAAFSALAGKGYQAMQSLLLDFCQWHSSEGILNALLNMLFDGKFDVKANPAIKVSITDLRKYVLPAFLALVV